MPRSGE
jgi:hypothetical protein